MEKKFIIYFKHNNQTLVVAANRFELTGSGLKFYSEDDTPVSDIFVDTDSVAAIALEQEPESKNSMPERKSTSYTY